MLPRARAPEETVRFNALHEIFEAEVDAHPESIAVIIDGTRVSYGDLEVRANRLAHYLIARGVRLGSRVAILLPRSLDAYVGILGILKAGAAYLPLDPDYPADRIDYILRDSHAEMLLTNTTLAERHASFKHQIIRVDLDSQAIATSSSERISRDRARVGLGDPCYVIYTSGSSGRPKGVEVEHRNVCSLVEAESKIFNVTPGDRVCQAASLSFDLSIEEIWLAFGAGANLVPVTGDSVHSGSELSRFLTDNRVTVLSCVPTLLSLVEGEVPSLRLLILGGETCPESLVQRWWRSGRRIVNTYGPTETTVTATYADLKPGRPVTIGRPLPGYYVRLLDEKLQPVVKGDPGEICVGGSGVARGYVGLSKETIARFVFDPFASKELTGARIYRTGDIGRFDDEGNLEFLGRSDGQVKLRGFRIELAEIESVLSHHHDVLAAACSVREDTRGVQHLVGYVVPRDGHKVDPNRLRLHLRSQLPSYMVPSLIETVTRLPQLPSGKLDRASLPAPRGIQSHRSKQKLPTNRTEKQIFDVWTEVFSPQPVSIDDDFFLDLGGHSLLAARMVSELRKHPDYSRVSVTDVYENPTIAKLAARIRHLSIEVVQDATAKATFEEPSPNQGVQNGSLGAGIAQTLLLYFVFGFRALEWMTPYIVFFLMQLTGRSLLISLFWALATAVVIFPVLLTFAILAKWLVLGHIRAGKYPLWGSYYVRWWFVQALVSSIPLDYLSGTPLLPFVYRLFGARIGRNVQLATENIAAFDQITIGDGSSIDDDSSLLGYTVKDGQLIIGSVRIGRRCYVGTRSVVSEETEIEEGARLEDLSLLQPGARIPAGEIWAGSPARRIFPLDHPTPEPPHFGRLRRFLTPLVYAVLVLILPLLSFSAIVPGVILLTRKSVFDHPLVYIAAIPLVGASFVVLIMLEVLALKWVLVGRVKPGTYPVHGGFYVRNWIVEQLYSLSLDLIAPLRATLYLGPWFRALGAKLGRFVELSTATLSTPDLLEIGDGATIADEVALGPSRLENGWMTISSTRIGSRSFLGNSAVVPGGATLGENSLFGVLTLPPRNPSEAAQLGASWLGNPPLRLPHRQPSTSFPDQRTYQPTLKVRLIRGFIELFRVTLPAAGFVLVTTAVVEAAIFLIGRFGLFRALLLLPLTYVAACTAVALWVVLAKWLVMGRFRPFTHPLYTTYIWRLEAVNALYEFLATPLVLEALQGTPLLPGYFRMLGAKIGKNVYTHTTGLIEFDLVKIGDNATLNQDCVLQTHLFEDRILKASSLTVGNSCNVGAYSIVLYDSQMEDGSHLDALSLLMKGETLPSDSSWAGIPAKRSR